MPAVLENSLNMPQIHVFNHGTDIYMVHLSVSYLVFEGCSNSLIGLIHVWQHGSHWTQEPCMTMPVLCSNLFSEYGMQFFFFFLNSVIYNQKHSFDSCTWEGKFEYLPHLLLMVEILFTIKSMLLIFCLYSDILGLYNINILKIDIVLVFVASICQVIIQFHSQTQGHDLATQKALCLVLSKFL